MRTRKIAVAFLVTEHKGIFSALLPFFDFLADKLKAREYVEYLCAVTSRYLIRKTRRDDSFDYRAVFGKRPLFFVAHKDIVHQKRAYLVAVEKNKFALCVFNSNAHTVAVGVSAYYYIAAQFVCKRDTQLKRVGLFGIGHNNRGKLRIGIFLFLYDRYGYAHLGKHSRNGNISRTVYRRIYDFDILAHLLYCLGRERKLGYLSIVLIVKTLANNRNMLAEFVSVLTRYTVVIFARYLFPVKTEVRGFVYIFYYLCRCLGRHLRAVLAVNLVAVVFLGIVAGGNHYARYAIELSYRKRAHRHGAHVFKQKYLYAVGCQHSCRGEGKLE